MKILIFVTVLLSISCSNRSDRVTALDTCEETAFSRERILEEMPVLDATRDRFVRTLPDSEHYNCILAPDVIDLDKARIIYSIKLENIQTNTLMHFDGWAELTNDTPKPMMVAWYFVLSDSPFSREGTEITQRRGFNITPGMHHGVVGGSGNYQFQTDHNEVYLNLVVYAASGEKSLTGESLIIEDNFGEMSVILQEN